MAGVLHLKLLGWYYERSVWGAVWWGMAEGIMDSGTHPAMGKGLCVSWTRRYSHSHIRQVTLGAQELCRESCTSLNGFPSLGDRDSVTPFLIMTAYLSVFVDTRSIYVLRVYEDPLVDRVLPPKDIHILILRPCERVCSLA